MSGSARFTLQELLDLTFIPASVAPADLAALTILGDLNDIAVVDLVGPLNGEGLSADGISGWEGSASSVPTPDLKSRKTGSIPGGISYGDSSLAFLAHRDQSTIRDALIEDASGWVCWGFTGQVAGELYEVFPVDIQLVTPMKSATSPHMFRVDFSVGVPIIGAFAAGV